MEAHQKIVSTVNCLLAAVVRIHLFEVACNKFQPVDGLLYDVMGSAKVRDLDGLTDLMTRATNRCINNMCSGDPRLHFVDGGGAHPPRRPLAPRSRRLPHIVTADVADVVARYYADAIMDTIEYDERVVGPQVVAVEVTNILRNMFLSNAHSRYAVMLAELERIGAVTVPLEFC
ncbi:hypothetical protein RB595_002199 [Gaeumannomyces hyphopodioides]